MSPWKKVWETLLYDSRAILRRRFPLRKELSISARGYASGGVPALSLRWFTLRGKTTNACAPDALVKERVSYQVRYLHNDGSWQRGARGIIGQMIRLFWTFLPLRRRICPAKRYGDWNGIKCQCERDFFGPIWSNEHFSINLGNE